MVIVAYNENSKPTNSKDKSSIKLNEVVIAAYDWWKALEDYPIADEEHYSNLEHGEVIEQLENWYIGGEYEYEYEYTSNDGTYGSRLSIEQAYKVYSHVSSLGNVDITAEYIDEDAVINAMLELEYIKKLESPESTNKGIDSDRQV